jgi:hypothetical protein
MTIKQQGGIFGRNPTFNDVDVEGTLTVDGNAVPDAGTILVDSDIGVTVQGYDADTAKRDTAQTFTAKQDFIFAGGGNYVAQFQNTTAATPYAVSIKDAASSSNGYPLLIISNSAGSDTYFRVDSGTSDITAGKNIRFLSSGLGIDFSATSGTGTSELFDDYEEGTYTASLYGNTTGPGTPLPLSSSYNTLAYTKIGRQVTITGKLETSGSHSASGYLRLTVPFVGADLSDSAGTATGSVFFYRTGQLHTNPSVITGEGTSTVIFYENTAGGDVTTINAEDMDAAIEVFFGFTYFTT